MEERIKKLIKPIVGVAIVVFGVSCLINKPESFSDFCEYIGYAVTADSILFIIYYKWAWKWIPWNRPPLLKSKYNGVINYCYNGVDGCKPIEITITQTWLSLKIETKTDINSSVSVSSSFSEEYGQKVLYYTYVTNPSAKVIEQNPIQIGTCRMVLNDDNTCLSGKYWTMRQTIGDIEWNATEM